MGSEVPQKVTYSVDLNMVCNSAMFQLKYSSGFMQVPEISAECNVSHCVSPSMSRCLQKSLFQSVFLASFLFYIFQFTSYFPVLRFF